MLSCQVIMFQTDLIAHYSIYTPLIGVISKCNIAFSYPKG